MQAVSTLMVVCTSVLLVACGGNSDGTPTENGNADNGGGNQYCAAGFVGGASSWSCVSCSDVDPLDDEDDFDPAIDGNSGTFTQFGFATGGGQITITASAPAGTVFAANSNAGSLMRFPSGIFNTIGVEFTARRNGAVVDANNDNSAVAGNVPGAGSDRFYGFSPALPFDEIVATVSTTGNAERVNFRVYEYCGER